MARRRTLIAQTASANFTARIESTTINGRAVSTPSTRNTPNKLQAQGWSIPSPPRREGPWFVWWCVR